MFDKAISVITTVFIVTAIGIVLRPGSTAPQFVPALTNGIAKMQTAAYGPR